MDKVRIGSSDLFVWPVIMGTWQAGKSMWVGIDDAETEKALRAGFEAGANGVDTAEVYGNGHSEKIVARALGPVRDQVVIMTKVFANHLAPDQVRAACERSLKHLSTDRIDLYQIHWPAGSFKSKKVPIADTMGALNRLKEEGKIRAIGVSNFTGAQLEEALQHGEVVSLQPPYSLFWRQVENDALPVCQKHGITVLAYSPLAQGLLTGRFGPGHSFEPGDHRAGNRLFSPDHQERVQQALPKLAAVAGRLGITMAQLALAWVTAHHNMCAIAGARNAAQMEENVRAAAVALTGKDMDELDAASRMVTDHLDSNPVQWSFG